jgi:hypothetical protein
MLHKMDIGTYPDEVKSQMTVGRLGLAVAR